MLIIPALLLASTLAFVDLKPQVDENFFFSSSDPQFKQAKSTDEKFSSQPQLILTVSAPDISDPSYLKRIHHLTGTIKSLEGVTDVKSLTDGPKNFQAALTSPFWRRLLIAENQKSSNLMVIVKPGDATKLVADLERIIATFNAEDFKIHIAGVPYVVEMLRRSLAHDFLYFSAIAVILFGLAMVAIFRSSELLLGMLASCTSAVLLTLLLEAAFGKKIGILTVNLGTIVFVMTLSHLVYMTFNWQTVADQKGKAVHGLAWEAMKTTFPASFWSMVCSSLGFGSLLIVEAKPLRELGFGGVLGTLCALACAYVIYPAYLAWSVPHKTKLVTKEPKPGFWSHRYLLPSIAVVLASLGLGCGLWRLNIDPNLLDYFKPHQELREGLEYVDRNGGSNPLMLVVEDDEGEPLNTPAAYQKLWRLQTALENQPGVGTVISLPVLMAEARRTPFAFMLSWESILRIMNKPEHGQIARNFITDDRRQTMFLIRMIETGRRKTHVEVVKGLRNVVLKEGFKTTLVGGIYDLQGRLSELVSSSLVTGLFWLNGLFVIIAWIVGRSIRSAVAMIVSLTLVPLCMLGGLGILHVPVDVISAPATNVCIGMAIDSMIHLMFAVRRNQAAGKKGWQAWIAGREEQWRGIVYSDVIIAAGFAIFALSSFPPTQRFGLVVVVGTIIDILANLFVLPLLGGAESGRRSSR